MYSLGLPMDSLSVTLGRRRPLLTTTTAVRPRHSHSRTSSPAITTAFKEGEEDERKPSPSSQSPSSFFIPAFTLRRERFFGQLASLGLAFSLVGESLTGLGPFSQLSLETGLDRSVLYFAALGIVVWQLVGGLLLPVSDTYSPWNIRDLERVKSGTTGGRVKMGRSQAMIGRMAMLGFAGASVTEWLWGGEGGLSHLGLIVRGGGVPLLGAPLWLTAVVGVLLMNAAGVFGVDNKE